MRRFMSLVFSVTARPDIRAGYERVSIASLPVEVLAHCFDYLPDHLLFRLAVLHVSRTWRATAFAFPSTWSVVRISDAVAHGHLLVDLVLSNTSAHPVDFVYDQHALTLIYFSSEGMGSVVEKHLPRFRSITWKTMPADALTLCAEAPLLERLHTRAFFSLRPQLLGGVPSRLSSLELVVLILPDTCPALATVRHLKSSADPGWNSRCLHLLFEFCPGLESLDLCILLRDPAQLPHGPAPRTLRRLRLDSIGNDKDFLEDISRVDLSAVCSSWQVLPQLQFLELVTFTVSDAYFALIVDGAVALSVLVGRESTMIRALQACSTQHTLELRHKLPPALEALELHVAGIVPYAAGVRDLTLTSEVFYLLTRVGAALGALSSLRLIVYPTTRFPKNSRFPWVHLDVFPQLPQLETLDVDVKDNTVVDPYVPAPPDAADTQALITRLDAALSSRSGTHVKITIHGVPQAVSRSIRAPFTNVYSISFS